LNTRFGGPKNLSGIIDRKKALAHAGNQIPDIQPVGRRYTYIFKGRYIATYVFFSFSKIVITEDADLLYLPTCLPTSTYLPILYRPILRSLVPEVFIS
jgi:hypothetical protein